MRENKKTILVVDDEKDLIGAIESNLLYEGFNVLTAENGEQGLATALREKPDLILLDLAMPKKDGIAVLKELREDAWGKDVDVIVMTNMDDMEKMADVLEQGATEYLLKNDISLEKLIERVRSKINQ